MKTTIIAPELAYQFVDELFTFYGLQMDIVSDRDPKFTSDFWMQVIKKLETTWSMSSTDHPQSDGQTERVNQIIEDMLQACWCKANKMGTLSPKFIHERRFMLIYIIMSCEVHKIVFEIWKICCILHEII